MAQASMYLEDMIQYWGTLGRTLTTRIQKASRDARKGTYGLDRMLSDAVALWAEGFEAWSAAWLGRGAVAPTGLIQVAGESPALRLPRLEELVREQVFIAIQ